ncbi:ribonuclease H-like domain-containing protein [Tanacetum coccineum]
MPNRRKKEYGMGLMLAPKSAKAFFTDRVPIRHGNVKLLGSPFFLGKFFWIVVEHSSLRVTEEAVLSNFTLLIGTSPTHHPSFVSLIEMGREHWMIKKNGIRWCFIILVGLKTRLVRWERCNSIVLSWLLNSVSEELFLGQIFSDNASEVWAELKETYDKLDGEFDIITKLPKCSYAAREDVSKHNQLIKLMQFLMGLNDVFQPIKSSLLARETLPDVKDAFVIISREESHRGIAFSSSGSVTKPQVSSFVAKSNSWNNNGKKIDNNKRVGNSTNNRGPNPNLHCTNCGKVGHTVDRCFDIIGYPPGYNKNTGKFQNQF